MKTYGELAVQIPVFLSSALVRGESSASSPCRVNPGERAPVPAGHRRLGGLQSPSGRYEEMKIHNPTVTRTPTPQSSSPISSRYTDCATTALIICVIIQKSVLTKMQWLLGRQSNLSTTNKLLLYKTILKPIWTYSIQLWGTASTSNI
jgi:hypothetical protein